MHIPVILESTSSMLYCIELKKRGLTDKARYWCSWSGPTLYVTIQHLFCNVYVCNGIPRKLGEEF